MCIRFFVKYTSGDTCSSFLHQHIEKRNFIHACVKSKLNVLIQAVEFTEEITDRDTGIGFPDYKTIIQKPLPICSLSTLQNDPRISHTWYFPGMPSRVRHW